MRRAKQLQLTFAFLNDPSLLFNSASWTLTFVCEESVRVIRVRVCVCVYNKIFVLFCLVLLTLFSSATSQTGAHLWFWCFCESLQMTQMSSWSTWQKSLRFSSCRLHISSDAVPWFWSLSCLRVSHRSFRAKLRVGWAPRKSCLHTGHERWPLRSHQWVIQDSQKLWPHWITTGSVNRSRHTGQVHVASGFDWAITPQLLLYCVIWFFANFLLSFSKIHSRFTIKLPNSGLLIHITGHQ